MGKILRLNGVTLTDTTAPKIIERDPIESDGSLFLFDGSHEFAQFSGLPAAGSYIPNVLRNKLSGITGASGSSLDLLVATSDENSSIFLSERTAKGGIHGISTQAGSQSEAKGYVWRAPEAVRAHVFANMGRAFYVSVWSKTTRAGLHTDRPVPTIYYTNSVGATGNYMFYFRGGLASHPPIGSERHLGAFDNVAYDDHSASLVTPTDRFASIGVSGTTGNPPTATDRIVMAVGLVPFGPWSGFNYNKAPSRIVYRAYMEDLTASGRTFEQVQAIDYVLFQAAFAPGGKFHGDTYTDPATLP